MEFEPFPKVPRLSREMTITEKIDGRNASVWVSYAPSLNPTEDNLTSRVARELAEAGIFRVLHEGLMYSIRAGSRTQFIVPCKGGDNLGFAAWVGHNLQELVKLGEGVHHGEWWGQGIGRGYGLYEKRFSLFNTARWSKERPECCHVVPVLCQVPFDTRYVELVMDTLKVGGSRAAPGFKRPEGVMIWHHGAYMAFKKTFEGDEKGKGP